MDSLRQLLSQARSDTARIRIQLQIASLAWRYAYNEEALQYAKQALQAATRINHEAFQADAHRLMGIAYTNKGEYDKAIVHFQLAQSIYISLPIVDTLNLARTINNIGLLYYYQGYNYVSLQYFHQALYLRRLIKDQLGISNSITNIGRIKLNVKEYDSARYYFRQAYAIRLSQNENYAISASLADIADSFRMSGKPDSAIAYYEQAYELSVKSQHFYNATFAASSISNIYASRQQYQTALRYAIVADSLASNNVSSWQHVRSHNALARAYIGLRQFNKAEQALRQAEKLGYISQARTELMNTYLLKYQLDSTTGNYKSALRYLIRYQNLKDSIASANKINQAIELKYFQETSEKKEALQALKNAKKLAALEEKNQRLSLIILIVITVALLLVTAGAIWIWQKMRKQNQKLAERQAIIEKFNEELTYSNEAFQQKATELEEAVSRLKKSNEELQELGREKDALIKIVAHDLKTPLQNIKKWITELKNNRSKSSDTAHWQQIEQSLEAEIALIEDILLLNFLENNCNPPKWEPISLHHLIEPHLQTHICKAAQKQIEFSWAVDVNEPVVSDPKLMLRIINSLLSNAVKFTFSGGKVGLHIFLQNDQLVIQVADQGQGIPLDEQKLLFTKFKPLSVLPTNNENGAGLGLAIVKKLVNKLNGEIKVKSTKGAGSVFTVYLPLQPVQSLV
ncbi:MAG: tetratricopeptide repeat protein [Cytophagales bacterium]|nr:tetratricopeptide repeat protein [Bernardetiaceae bacterium]MDW8205291.1 tetratricopeptide repeat protein [Cytophagales bacterium]